MANVVCVATANFIVSPSKSSNCPSVLSPKPENPFKNPSFRLLSKNSGFHCLKAKAKDSNQSPKTNSIVCADCEGNGAILCTQCKGTGVNSVDYFNGQFKAGASCWLCRGKRDILCGNCNGAGFMGGFMSSFDETSS